MAILSSGLNIKFTMIAMALIQDIFIFFIFYIVIMVPQHFTLYIFVVRIGSDSICVKSLMYSLERYYAIQGRIQEFQNGGGGGGGGPGGREFVFGPPPHTPFFVFLFSYHKQKGVGGGGDQNNHPPPRGPPPPPPPPF